MSFLLANVAEEVTAYVDGAVQLVGFLLDVVTRVGALLIQVLSATWSVLASSWLGLIGGLDVLLRDLLLFVEDVHDLTEGSLAVVHRLGSWCVHSAAGAWSLGHRSLTEFHRLLGCTLAELVNVGLAAVGGVKQLLVLIGDGTLWLVQLGPQAVASVASSIWLLCSTAGHEAALCLDGLRQGFRARLLLPPRLTAVSLVPGPSSLVGLCLAALFATLLTYCLPYVRTYLQNLLKMVSEKCQKRYDKWRTPTAKRRLNESSSSLDEPSLGCKDNEAAAVSKRSLLKQLEREREDKLCIICQDQFKCIILLPCRHFCLCQECMRTLALTNPICPICRQFVYDNLKIYS